VIDSFRIVAAGDACILLQFDDRIAPDVNARAVAAAAALDQAALPGVRDIVPTFRSLAVHFDPLQTHYEALMDALREAARLTPGAVPSRASAAVTRIPVCYGGEFGPDLPEIARFAGLSEDAVVDLHRSVSYRVFMLGFMPGFAYLGSVPERIAAPRRPSPRTRVSAGSVGIAGAQTGVYPADTPGGWQVIGRTPVRVFDILRPEPCLFAPGDTVQFQAVDRATYQELAGVSAAGT
jgi:inhibitor of KinA